MIFSRISVVFPNFSPQKWRFMQEKTQGVVLRTLKYNDNSLIVDIYTAIRGTVSFMVKLPKSRKAALKGVFFRPLSILEIDFDYRQKSALQRIRDVRFKYVYQTLPYDPRKSSMALFLAEFLCRVLKHEEGSDTLFSYILYSLQWLDASGEGFSNFHLVFLTRLTRFLGFYPNVEEWYKGDCFDMVEACFVSSSPSRHAYLEPQEAALIPLFMRMNYDTMRFFAMNRLERGRYLEVLDEYYRLHVPEFPELKSLDVLKEVFA